MPLSERRIFSALSQDLLAGGVPFVFIARGRSMAPFIADGDSVVIDPGVSDVRAGDVVLRRSADGAMLLHRVIKKCAEGVITRGDACLSDDGFCWHEDIAGKAVKVVGRGTNVPLFFPVGYLLVLILRVRRYSRVRPLRSFITKVFHSPCRGKGC